jgi:predicted amidohydrolase
MEASRPDHARLTMGDEVTRKPAALTLLLVTVALLSPLRLLAQSAPKEVRSAMPTDAPPRKVTVGTTMHAMYGKYPGLDARLQELSDFVDRMAAEAKRKYGAGLDLAVLPENAVTGGLEGGPAQTTVPLEGKVLAVMGEAARRNHTYIVVAMGLAEDPAQGIYTNAGVLLDRGGKPAGIYRKVHLVDSARAGNLEGGLTPGKEFPVFQCDWGTLGIEICYDMAYDDGWQALGLKGAEIVAWPSASPQTVRPRLRALQGNYYVVSSTWRNNASFFDPMGGLIAQTVEPSSVLVEQIDLSYIVLDWQPTLNNGKALADRYGKAVGYRYSEAEDCGIFWSNDPKTPITRMVRELGLELRADAVERSRRLQDQIRGCPPSRD